MSTISNIQNLSMSGSTINVVSGNQTFITVYNDTSTVPTPPSLPMFIADASTPRDTQLPLKRALPRLSAMFTGREDILEQLIRYFSQSETSVALLMQRIFILYGLGGAGKSQIMFKFVDEFSSQFSDVYYIDGSTLATLQSSFEDIARAASAGQTVDDALRWLSQRCKEWLLLLDNIDHPGVNLRRFLPPCKHGNIIVTTRNPACRIHAPDSNCCVSSMDPDDATGLLLKYAMVERSEKNRSLCSSIARELGYLALAVAQAGAYIAQSHCLDDYLRIYQEDRAELLRRHSVQTADDYEWTVYTTWEISLKKLSPIAAMFLRICAFMHYDGISCKIFKDAAACAEDSGDSFQGARHFLQNFKSQSGRWSDVRFFDSINELASYSLINVNAEGNMYSIHPLVHAWARDRTRSADYIEAQTCTMQILALSITDDYSAEAFAFRRTLLPHADQACTESIESDVAAKLQKIYTEASRWDVAERLQRRVMETRKRELGDDHPNTLTGIADVAKTYCYQRRFREAEDLQNLVMEKRNQILGRGHLDTLNIMADLADTYMSEHRWKEAEDLKSEVLQAKRTLLGQEHRETLEVMSDLAAIYSSQNRWKEAEAMQLEVLTTRRRLLGDKHPDTLLVMSGLADTISCQDRWKEAEELQVQVLATRRTLLGDEHPDTLTAVCDLAATISHQGRLKEAEVMQLESLAAWRRLLGDEHPYILLYMMELAATVSRQSRLNEAEAMQVEALASLRRLFGDEHPDTLIAMAWLAVTYSLQGHWKKAERLQAEMLTTWRRLLGNENPSTLTTMAWLAATFSLQSCWKEAEGLQVEVLTMRRKVLGNEHPATLNAMMWLADTFSHQNRWKEAGALQATVLETGRRLLGQDHLDTLEMVIPLVTTYRKQKRWKAATAVLAQFVEDVARSFGDAHPYPQFAIIELCKSYRDQKLKPQSNGIEKQKDERLT